MWKIFIEYDDKSKVTLTGKHDDIPLHLAAKYHQMYVSGRKCKSIYQRYPKKYFAPMSLFDKICELEEQQFD